MSLPFIPVDIPYYSVEYYVDKLWINTNYVYNFLTYPQSSNFFHLSDITVDEFW